MSTLAPSPQWSAPPAASAQRVGRAGRAGQRTRNWTTPRRLQVQLFLGWLLVLAFTLVTVIGVREMRAAIATIGQTAAPNVFTTQAIRATLSDLDANAAIDLLAAPKGSRVARDGFDGGRTFLSHRLLDAATHIAPGTAERKSLDTLADDAIAYEELVTQARDASRQSPADGAYLFSQATTLLHGEMLPAAAALTASSAQTVERVYSEQMRLLVAVAVLLATVLLIALAAHLAVTLMAAERDLRVAKEDAYNSLTVLTKTHAVAADARGDENLALLDRANAAAYEASFGDKMRQIADKPVDAPLIDAATRGDIRFGGYLATELRNVTFPSEGQAALDTLRGFGQYQTTHAQIMMLVKQGRYAEATALTTGTGIDQAGGVFDTFDRALSRAVYINQNAFDSAISRSANVLRYEDLLTVVAAVLIAGLMGVGFQSRLREYAV